MYWEARGVFSRPGHLDEDEKEGRDHSKERGKRIKKIIEDKRNDTAVGVWAATNGYIHRFSCPIIFTINRSKGHLQIASFSKDFSFTIINDKEKPQALAFKKL